MPQISGHIDLRPITQGLAIIPRVKSSSRTSIGDFSRRNSLKSDSGRVYAVYLVVFSLNCLVYCIYLLLFFTASSVQSVADENLSLVDIENVLLERVRDRKDDLKVAFEAFDQEGNKTVTKGEFRRVIEGFLVPLTESQFEGLLAEVCSFRITAPFSVHLLLFCGTKAVIFHLKCFKFSLYKIFILA